MDDESRARWAIRDLREMLEDVMDTDETETTDEIAAAHALHGLDRAEDVLVEPLRDGDEINPFAGEPREIRREIGGKDWELMAALFAIADGRLEAAEVREAFEDVRGIATLVEIADRESE